MRIAVAGGTGTVGHPLVEELRRAGHEPVVLARSTGIDLRVSEGLVAAIDGAATIVDVTNGPAATPEEAVKFFGLVTGNLLAAGEQAGVRHYVLLSIVGVDRVNGPAHYTGKRIQEALVRARTRSRRRSCARRSSTSSPK